MKGATLYDLLGKEVDMREKRHNVLARQLEITEVEQALRSAIKGVDEEIKVGILEMHVLNETQVRTRVAHFLVNEFPGRKQEK